jgi:hypothetical protein
MHRHPSGYLYILTTPITSDTRWDPISFDSSQKEGKNGSSFVVGVDFKAGDLNKPNLFECHCKKNVNLLCGNTHQ